MLIEKRLEELGIVLPEPFTPPPGVELPFPAVHVRGERALISGHGPVRPDGSTIGPAGKVGADVTLEQAYASARATGLVMIASLRRELGDLDRVASWLRVFGMVNVAAGFTATPAVINGFSELILQVWGPEAGRHARSAIGVAELPFDIPVEVEAEVVLRPEPPA